MGTTASKPKEVDEIRFFLQNEEHTVKVSEIAPQTTLNDYIRNTLSLTGTKTMCREGACGSCVVVFQGKNPTTQHDVTLAVNSCLISVLSCHGWKIFTVESIGNPLNGFHPFQTVLANFNGTQCGFCSPGMVMKMYALHESMKENLTMAVIEKSFSGNICRCTGYRPILSAFKTLAPDMDPTLLGTITDIEDLKICKKTNERCTQKCSSSSNDIEHVEPFYQIFAQSKWIKVLVLADVLDALNNLKSTATYMLVHGNTARGVFADYRSDKDLFIDISFVSELKSYQVTDANLTLGANITLTDTIAILNETADKYSSFAYLKKLAAHIEMVATLPVRNIGSLAGNLIIKHDHEEFPSDIFLVLETAGALLTVVDTSNKEVVYSPRDFIAVDLNRRVLKSISLPAYDDTYKYVSYKIMPRAQGSHAIVNAGFLFKLNGETIQSASIVYGNINPTFVHATEAEAVLANKNLFDNATLKTVCQTLDKELVPEEAPPEPSGIMRKGLAIALLYKAVLSLAPDTRLSDRNKTGGSMLERPISSGAQDYETTESLYPLTKNIPKIEALAQTSGQAQYIPDLPDLPNQLFAVFVLANTPPTSKIQKIDSTKALAVQGVAAVLTKDDIPGTNFITAPNDEILCSGDVKFYEQPVALVVASSVEIAKMAVNLVDVTYSAPTAPALTNVRQILKAGRTDKIKLIKEHKRTRRGTDVQKKIKGTFDIGGQYHYHMETQTAQSVPTEDGLDVYSSTQWVDLVQSSISKMINLPAHKINVTVRRCGGAFGAKVDRAALIACATSLAAWKLRKPVRMWLDLPTNMKIIGKRYPLSANYTIALDKNGVIQYLTADLYSDVGVSITNDEPTGGIIMTTFLGSYLNDTFKARVFFAFSDTPANTYCRAPRNTEAIASLESILEHAAYELGIDPVDLRKANISDENVTKYINDLYNWADIAARKQAIAEYNKQNRWKKKGLAVVPMTFFYRVIGPYSTMVTIFATDGSVQISHGGIEIGQGINTKAVQVCAWKFGIPVEKVHVTPTYSYVTANSQTTGGSQATEAVCYGITLACDELLARMKPFRSNDQSWEQLVNTSFENGVDLVARAQFTEQSPGVSPYKVYGASAAEVLLDVLTGQYILTRADVVIDTGRSLSPGVDIGQVEGSFIMGAGYHTTEKLVYDSNGQILTYNNWTYPVPGANDIPVDFRVKFPKNNYNPVGVLQCKTTTENTLCMSVVYPFAIRNAVASARTDANPSNSRWYPIDGPSTVENTLLNCLNDYNQYTL